MINLIPAVKKLEFKGYYTNKSAVLFDSERYETRIAKALEKLPFDKCGIPLDISILAEDGEEYEINIDVGRITVIAFGSAAAFYAIQTLRQLARSGNIPCVYIKDKPDFKYRGFYHDVTRGKIPTVATVKTLIDNMAYYKLNSLQLYVEHTFEFEECEDIINRTGFFTKEELQEIDLYCRENFIDFIPSLSTFGHMYEILEQSKYNGLRVLKDHIPSANFWHERMAHHTLDPLQPESIKLVKSLIDQFSQCFSSKTFNICCDETFDLTSHEANDGSGKLYADFVKQIISYIKEKDLTVMMWADILLQYPKMITELPDDIVFLNWKYSANPSEQSIIKFKHMDRKQIVCPGTSSWSRLCENVDIEEKNISLMAEYGYKHNAIGVLNTNWGDWGNPCSIELAMYGLVLGAEKSWSAETVIDDSFREKASLLLYGNSNGFAYLKAISELSSIIKWRELADNYFRFRSSEKSGISTVTKEIIETAQDAYSRLSVDIKATVWENIEYREEMLLALEGECVIAELLAKTAGIPTKRLTNTFNWLKRYREKWIAKNKESELSKIEEVFTYIENL